MELRSLEKEAQDSKYIVFGESHDDEEILDDVLLPLIDEAEFDTVFCEAYQRQGNGRDYHVPGGVFGWNKEKYNRFMHRVEQKGIDFYGLDSPKFEREEDKVTNELYDADDTSEIDIWAEEITSLEKDLNLILVGSAHVIFPFKDIDFQIKDLSRAGNLPNRLNQRGVPKSEILAIPRIEVPEDEKKYEAGIHGPEEPPFDFSEVNQAELGDLVYLQERDLPFN